MHMPRSVFVGQLADFVASTPYDDIPQPVTERLKLHVLDTLGAALACAQLRRHAKLLPIYNSPGPASVWGGTRQLSMRDAVVLNSFLSDALYLVDGSRYTGGHPSTVVVPSALTLAGTRGTSGRRFLAAVSAGYEVFLRLGRAIYPHAVVQGFHSTSVLAGVASAAACASVMQLSPEMARHALTIGCCLGVGLKEAHHAPQSQPISVARGCEAGLIASLFAEQGADGADAAMEHGFLKVFAEHPDTARITEGLGRDYRLFETYIKVHGGCRGNHAPVDVVLGLVRDHALDTANIEDVRIRVDSVTFAANIPAPANGEQSQFSIAFAAAAALLKGDASVFQYTDANVADAGVRALMGRIRVEVDTVLDLAYPRERASSVSIGMRDGSRYDGYISNARGEPETPLAQAEIEAKFMNLARGTLRDRGERVRDLVLGLEGLEDVSTLTEALRADMPAGA
jgi:2-methylcitrate dehydratase PrpD